MNDIKLTPEQYADLIFKEKPHLAEIEDQIKNLDGGFGAVEVTMTIRAGEVAKMEFHKSSTWLREKSGEWKP